MGGGRLLDSRTGHRLPAVGEAHRGGEERREGLAPGQLRIDQGPGRAGQVPVTQRLHRGRGVPARLGTDRGGPGQDGRRRPGLHTARDGGPRPGGGPDPVGRREGRGNHPPGQRGRGGLGQHGQGRWVHPRHHPGPRGRPGLLPDRPAGQRGGQQQDVQRDRQHPAVFHRGRGHRRAADHLPEPGAVGAAGPLLRRRADHRGGSHLPPGRARRADGECAERRHPGRAGLRGQHRLCTADRRPLPGGTAPPPPPPPGHDRGAAAGWPGHHRKRVHRHRGAADLVSRGTERDQEPGPGAGHRGRRRHAGHAHPDARPAGQLPEGDLLALPAQLRLGRADLPGDVGAGLAGASPPGHAGCG